MDVPKNTPGVASALSLEEAAKDVTARGHPPAMASPQPDTPARLPEEALSSWPAFKLNPADYAPGDFASASGHRTESSKHVSSPQKAGAVPSVFQEMGLKETTGEKQGVFHRLGKSSVNNYYPLLRFLGYFFSATYSPIVGAVAKYADNVHTANGYEIFGNPERQPFGVLTKLSVSPYLSKLNPYLPEAIFGKDFFNEQSRLFIPKRRNEKEWADHVIEKFDNPSTSIVGKLFHRFIRTNLHDRPYYDTKKGEQVMDGVNRDIPRIDFDGNPVIKGDRVIHRRDTQYYNEYSKNVYIKPAKLLVSKIEAFIFAGLTTYALWRDLKGLKNNVAAAVGAEFAKPAEKVGVIDLLRSNNPIVVQAVKRMKFQAVIRYGADGSFLFGLKAGLIAEAVRTTLERSMFTIDKLPYDYLVNAVKEVQEDQLTLAPKERLVNAFINAIQRTRKEFGREAMYRDQIETMYPVFETMAEATLSKKLGINEAIYLLGLGVDELRPEQSLVNVNAVIENGLSGVVSGKKNNPGFVMPAAPQTPDAAEEHAVKNSKAVEAILAQGRTKPRPVKPAREHTVPQQVIAATEPVGFGRF